MKLKFYKVHDHCPQIIPGRQERDWMERAQNKWPYRCLPLTIANTSGWEVLSPCSFSIYYNGLLEKEDIKIICNDDYPHFSSFVKSHFSNGVVTFDLGYVVRSEPGWSTWVMGPPNFAKHGIAPLSGLVETDWLPYTFTMNWLLTAPGVVHFEKGEPFCFLTLVQDKLLDDIEPEILPIAADPELQAQQENWAKSRDEYQKALNAGDPAAKKEGGWQKYYYKGKIVGEDETIQDHVIKRRLSGVQKTNKN